MRSVVAVVLAAALAAVAATGVAALPPAGTDELPAEGQVSVTSLLGQETLDLTGTVTVARGEPYLDGGVEVVDAEIVSMNLVGQSVTGPVSVTESATLASTGQIRSLQPAPDDFPASSFFDVFVVVQAPASPDPTIVLHNDAPLHATASMVLYWPPISATYAASPNPCVPLLPSEPMEACVTSLSVTLSGAAVGGVAELASIEGASSGGRGMYVAGRIALIVFGAAVLAAVAAVGVRRRRSSS